MVSVPLQLSEVISYAYASPVVGMFVEVIGKAAAASAADTADSNDGRSVVDAALDVKADADSFVCAVVFSFLLYVLLLQMLLLLLYLPTPHTAPASISCPRPGFINFDEYTTMANNHPAMLNQMSLNVSGMIASRQNSMMDLNMDSSDDEGEGKAEGKE
jgi:hypothetical protein